MSALASPVVFVGLGACLVAAAAFALAWWREPSRRAARTAATRLGGRADIVFTAPLRGQGVGLRVQPPGVAVVRHPGDAGLVFGFEEVIGIELIFDGEVRARAFRGEPRRPLDLVRPAARQVGVRLVFDDVRYPDFELELIRTDDGPIDPGPSIDAARKLFAHVEAIVRQPPEPAPPQPGQAPQTPEGPAQLDLDKAPF
jgi:hypothetical protein